MTQQKKKKTFKKNLFRVASPDKKNGKSYYHPIVRIGQFIPFGYREDPNDPQVLLPVEKELDLFEEAKKHLKKYSLRDVAEWLSHNSGRDISHTGLRLRVMSEQTKAKDYLQSKRILNDLIKAYKKARRFEESRLGKRDPTEEELHNELFREVEKSIKGSL